MCPASGCVWWQLHAFTGVVLATQDMGVDAVLQCSTLVEQGGVLTRTRRSQLCYDMAALTQELKQRYAPIVTSTLCACACECLYLHMCIYVYCIVYIYTHCIVYVYTCIPCMYTCVCRYVQNMHM